MGRDDIHDLTAAYALDALDEPEVQEYEEHLRDCPRCRDELREVTEVAAALAYAAPAPAPPPALRERILDDVRRERSNVIPFPRRRPFWVATGLAAAAACAALALGLWASSLRSTLDEEREARGVQQAALEVVSNPEARRISLSGRQGALYVVPDGTAALLVDLEPAPEGKDYEAWVVDGEAPVPAGVFEGGRSGRALRLDERVRPGSQVLVTLEEDGGVEQPTGQPLLRASA